MSEQALDLLFKNGYFVEVKKHESRNDVCFAKFPQTILKKLPETVYQYFLDKDELLCTNLTTKETNKIPVTKLNCRIIFMADIIAQTIRRDIPLTLVRGVDSDNNNIKILNMFPQDSRLIDREQELMKIFTSLCSDNPSETETSQGNIESRKLLETLLKSGGIVK